jgi:hypothetical protein
MICSEKASVYRRAAQKPEFIRMALQTFVWVISTLSRIISPRTKWKWGENPMRKSAQCGATKRWETPVAFPTYAIGLPCRFA